MRGIDFEVEGIGNQVRGTGNVWFLEDPEEVGLEFEDSGIDFEGSGMESAVRGMDFERRLKGDSERGIAEGNPADEARDRRV